MTEGAQALLEGDDALLRPLGMRNSEEVAASDFDAIGTALYGLRKRIAEMKQSHLSATMGQSNISE